jgi:hypothetical protein
MTAILISVILGLIVNECSDVCPWCARKVSIHPGEQSVMVARI